MLSHLSGVPHLNVKRPQEWQKPIRYVTIPQQLRFVIEIALKSPFLCVNKSLIQWFWCRLIYILYGVNISPHQPPPQALCFSQGRGATGDEPQGTMGRVQTAGVVAFPPFFIERETSGYEAVTPHKEKFESCFFISLSLQLVYIKLQMVLSISYFPSNLSQNNHTKLFQTGIVRYSLNLNILCKDFKAKRSN